MIKRRFWLPIVGLSLLALVGLLIAGSRGVAVRTATLDTPDQGGAAILHPSSRVCEGPITSPASVRSVHIWGAPTTGRAGLTVDVQDATETRDVLASGELEAVGNPSEYTVRLSQTVPKDRPLRVCLTEHLNSFILLGTPGVHHNVVLSGIGSEFALALVNDSHRSLLSWLPTAFSRASLWRPSWVGSWTFWILAAALLTTFGIGAAAVASAAAEDDEEDPRAADRNGEGDRRVAG